MGERKLSDSIQVVLNGERREVPPGLNVAALLRHMGLSSNRVAIELNLNILPRAAWERTVVSDGDRFEIVHLVGGG